MYNILTKGGLNMVDAETYQELRIPKGGAKAFVEALTAMNDKTAPGKSKPVAEKPPKKQSAQTK